MFGQSQEQSMRWRKFILPLLLPIVGILLLLYLLPNSMAVESGAFFLAHSSPMNIQQVTPHYTRIVDCLGENLPGSGNPFCKKCALLIESKSSQQTVLPGGSADYKLSVGNTGNCTGKLALSATSLYRWGVNISPSSPINLPAGEWSMASLRHTAPVSASDGASDQVTVTGTLACKLPCGGFATQAITIVTTLNVTRSVELTPGRLAQATAGQTVHLGHTLTNTGNYTDVFCLNASSVLGWPVSFSTTTVRLAASASTIITASVSVPPSAQRGQIDTVVITATSANASQAFDRVTDQIQVLTSGCEVSLGAIEPNQSAIPGQSVTYTLLVSNIGAYAGATNLEIGTPTGWSYHVTPPPTTTLLPGQSADWLLRLTVPSYEQPGIKTTGATAVLTSTEIAQTDIDSIVITTTIHRPPTFSVYLPVIPKNFRVAMPLCNGDFEAGNLSCWRWGGELPVRTAPRISGYHSALLGNPDYACSAVPQGRAWLEQDFGLPSYGKPRLSFDYELHTKDNRDKDSFKVYLKESGNEYLILEVEYIGPNYKCRTQETILRGKCTIDLANPTDCYGQPIDADLTRTSVTIRFESWNPDDTWYNTWSYVDNVEFTW